jgi:hypothetical protein
MASQQGLLAYYKRTGTNNQGRKMMSKEKSKRARNSRQHFLKTYLAFYKAGKSREELAEELGMQLGSLYHRIHVERKAGNKLPLIPLAEDLVSTAEIDAALEELDALATGKPVKKKAKKPDVVVDEADVAQLDYTSDEDSEEEADLDDIEALLNG